MDKLPTARELRAEVHEQMHQDVLNREAMHADRLFMRQFDKRLIEQEKQAERQRQLEQAGVVQEEQQQQQLSWKSFLLKNRYPILATVWTTAVVGTLAFNYRRVDISKSQKAINARLVSQTAAFAGMAGISFVSTLEDSGDAK